MAEYRLWTLYNSTPGICYAYDTKNIGEFCLIHVLKIFW